jgi:hypothetical protein
MSGQGVGGSGGSSSVLTVTGKGIQMASSSPPTFDVPSGPKRTLAQKVADRLMGKPFVHENIMVFNNGQLLAEGADMDYVIKKGRVIFNYPLSPGSIIIIQNMETMVREVIHV